MGSRSRRPARPTRQTAPMRPLPTRRNSAPGVRPTSDEQRRSVRFTARVRFAGRLIGSDSARNGLQREPGARPDSVNGPSGRTRARCRAESALPASSGGVGTRFPGRIRRGYRGLKSLRMVDGLRGWADMSESQFCTLRLQRAITGIRESARQSARQLPVQTPVYEMSDCWPAGSILMPSAAIKRW